MIKKAGRRDAGPPLELLLGFLLVIAAGVPLLKLPVSVQEGVSLSWFDALFVSTSAVCVTGLTPVVLADTFTPFGLFIVALLVEVGGLSFATFAAVFFMALRAKTSGTLIRESFGVGRAKWRQLVKVTVTVTLVVETIGALLLWLFFSADYPLWDALGHAAFTSVAAFCNAGFDSFGTSLVGYSSHPGVIITVALLIVSGGLGFIVYADIADRVKGGRLHLQAKIVLTTTPALIVAGMLLYLIPGDMDLLDCFFQSVTARTAGFESVPQKSLGNYEIFLTCVLMFIGASPGSTGGGVKTTTFFTMLSSFRGVVDGGGTRAFRRRIPQEVVLKAMAVVTVSISIVALFSMALMALEPDVEPLSLIFEVVSAFATVGLSEALTPELGVAARSLLIVLMYVGRVGPLTITGLVESRRSRISLVEEGLGVG